MTTPVSGQAAINAGRIEVGAAQDKAAAALIQEESAQPLKEMEAEDTEALGALFNKFEKATKEERAQKAGAKSEVGNKEKPLTAKQATDMADEFAKQNPEMKAKDLLSLLDKLNPGDTKERVLELVFFQYPDLNEADKALTFLSKSTGGALQANVLDAKKDLLAPLESITAGDSQDVVLTKLRNAYPHPNLINQALDKLLERPNVTGVLRKEIGLAKDTLVNNFKLEIGKVASANLGTMQKAGLAQSVAEVSTMYSDLKSKTWEAQTLFVEIQKMSYKQQIAYLTTMESMIGKELKEGPSIEHAKLHDLFSQVRVLQAIFFVYRICQNQMNFLQSKFAADGLPFPPGLTHETLARELMKLIAERYPSPEKVDQLCKNLGITADTFRSLLNNMKGAVQGKIIMADLLIRIFPQLAPDKIYRTRDHIEQVKDATIKFGERCQEELEVLEEEEQLKAEGA